MLFSLSSLLFSRMRLGLEADSSLPSPLPPSAYPRLRALTGVSKGGLMSPMKVVIQ